MKKGQTMEQYMAELEKQKLRAEAFADVIRYIDNEINWKCDQVELEEGYYETYFTDEGEEKQRWHSAVYQTDENGDYVRIPPKEDSWSYPMYQMLNQIKDEILAII